MAMSFLLAFEASLCSARCLIRFSRFMAGILFAFGFVRLSHSTSASERSRQRGPNVLQISARPSDNSISFIQCIHPSFRETKAGTPSETRPYGLHLRMRSKAVKWIVGGLLFADHRVCRDCRVENDGGAANGGVGVEATMTIDVMR